MFKREEKDLNNVEKLGFLNHDFKVFHLVDSGRKEYNFHYHDFHKILIFLRGNVNYFVEGKNYVLNPYDIVLIQAGEIHRPSVLDSSEYERIIIYVSTEFLKGFSEEEYDLSLCFSATEKERSHVQRFPSLDKSKLYQVCMEVEKSLSDKEYANTLYQKILFLEFMIWLNRMTLSEEHEVTIIVNDSKLRPILLYINEHLQEEITIDTLAEQFFMSRYYLMHSFKKETGYTIGNYLTKKRLLLARELLKGGLTSTEACFHAGFKNYSSYLRAFKKEYHTTPKVMFDLE